MTDYTFVVNGTDLSQFVDKYSYQTDYRPEESSRVTTLDGIDHVRIARYRGYLTIKTTPMTLEDYKTFCNALLSSPARVKYTSLQRNVDVTETMTFNQMQTSHGLKNANRTVVAAMQVQFVQV